MSEQMSGTAGNADTRALESMMTAALHVYREAMRRLIVRVLSDLPGLTLTEAVEQTLRQEELHRVRENIEEGAPLDQTLDVAQFGRIFVGWREHFGKYIGNTWDSVTGCC